MKIFCLIILLITLTFNVSAQAQRLSVQQIIDSALLKHPKLLNARVSVESMGYAGKQAAGISRTEIIYRQGYLYSNTTGHEFEVRQNIGSPATWIAGSKVAKQEAAVSEAQYKLQEKLVVADIKHAYCECVFRNTRYKLLHQQQDTLFKLINSDSTHLFSDSVVTERVLIENLVTDAASQTDMAYNDLLVSENNLVQASFLDSETIPADSLLKMYELLPIPDTATRTPARLFGAKLNSEYQLEKAKVRKEQSQYYPDIFLGYKNYSTQGVNNLNAWQIGFSLPLFFLPQRANVKSAKLDLIKTENELRWQESEIQATTANLMVQMNKDFERLNYFYNHALRQAELIETQVRGKIKNSSGIQLSDIQNLIYSYKIQLDYYETLNRYNQNAIELEVYAY